ncbi:T9SS type A sorting domain-containing protein [Lacibacter luteus]|uniref:T9SS type A sorting domain-containing protein n=1 Tax=Lacibacter luteus TaxID=2508719 RepID=A0A4Q1CN06_9BACT|nr:T9SS type A sorting domain-containing protein [Lacibacter luteus]RXK62477.1 T9SS type A sorting domain-containing protein [Lacibacter luteus]
MKKFLLIALVSAFAFVSNAQIIESFNGGTLPAGWDVAQGMSTSPYNNPDSACKADYGLLTPGVGGNNPAKVLTAPVLYGAASSFINAGFTIYIFDSNLKCESKKDLPCVTYVQVYLVKESWTSASIPPASEIYSQSQVQIVQANTANILVVPSGNVPVGQKYRVLYDFSVAANCNQNGTKYILDLFKVITTIGGPLPVTLTGFEAAQKSGKVTLTWNTLMELNNDGFEIERRIGTGSYQKIAFVDSKAPGGNGAAYSYSFDDNTALPKGVTYYRLKQIDLDGNASYSEIRAVRSANGTLLLSVYPNPSRGTTNVAIPAGTGMVDVTLTDFTGKSLQQWTGVNTSNLQLTNLKPGMYTLRVSVRATGETITERIAVQ